MSSREPSPVRNATGKRKKATIPSTPAKKSRPTRLPITPASDPVPIAFNINASLPESPTPTTASSTLQPSVPATDASIPPKWETAYEKFAKDLRNIMAHSDLKWATTKLGRYVVDSSSTKPLDLVFLGEIVSADLDEYKRSSFGKHSYGLALRIGDDVKQKFLSILEADDDYSNSDFASPLDNDNTLFFKRYYKDAFSKKDMRSHSADTPPPFPGLRDGRTSHLLCPGDILPPIDEPSDFVEGATVAVQARIFKYDFTKDDGRKMIGVNLKMFGVFLLEDGPGTNEVITA